MNDGIGEASESAGMRLNELLTEAGLQALDAELTKRFETYLSLLLRWNAKINLTAIRDEEGILSRHFVESIACARALPAGVSTLLDLGSGAGFPGIPIALCRPEIVVTLAESQGKKAAFLLEAARVLGAALKVHCGRAETLAMQFDCVTLRAVDRMQEAVRAASRLIEPSGLLALMTSSAELGSVQTATGPEFSWSKPIPLPGSEGRVLVLGNRVSLPS